MADALHSQSPQDGNEARSAACGVPVQPDISPSSNILSPGDILPPTAETSSSRFLQPPTFSFTPATPSPPLPTPHEGIEDAVIRGLLSGGVNSLNSPPLGKDASIEPDPLSLPGVLEGIQKVDSGSNAELPDMSENSLDTFSSIVNSTSLNFREISDCLEQPGDIPVSSASMMDSRNRNETHSKDIGNSPTVPLVDSLEKQVDGTSERMSDLMNANDEGQKAVDPPLASPPAKEFDGGGWKHSFASGEGTNCSNGVVQDSKTNSVGHSILQPEDPVVEPVCSELVAKELPSPLSEFRAEFAMESQPENCLGSGGSNSENTLLNLLPSEMQNSSEDSLSLPNSTVADPSKDTVANSLLVCKDVNMTDTGEKEKYLCGGTVAADLASLTENTDLLSQIENTSNTCETEAMDVDEVNDAEKLSELEKTLERMDEVHDKSEVQSAKEKTLPETSLPENPLPETSLPAESSLPEFATSKDGSNKTECGDGKAVSGVARKVSSVLLNDSDEPLQPVTIGGSLQPLEEVQEASILNDPSFTADLSLIDSSADEADSIGGLVINSVIGAADGVADFPPDDEMEAERQLTDISSSAPRVNQESCEVDSSEDVEPSAKRRKLENGEKEGDKMDDPRSVVFKVLPVKNGHGLWDALKLKEVLLSKGTIHLRIHTSASEFGNFEPEKCEIEVDFTCIMVSALEEECNSPLGNAVPDPDSCDPLAIVANAGAVETNSPPHYPRPFGAQTRGRSTALQPAMPRPPYRHLQSPPHAYNKNEVLGLPQGIEFEEPQNATEWSGAGSRRVTPRVQAEPHQPSRARTHLLPQPSTSVQLDSGKKMDQVDSEKGPNRKAKEEEEEEVGWKVCVHCGWVFSELLYPYHVLTHKPWLKCQQCSFATKSCDRFKAHEDAHKEGKLAVVCKLCRGQYLNETTLKVHCRRVHGIIICRDCSEGFPSEAAYASHRDEVHNDPTLKIKCIRPSGSLGVLPVVSRCSKRSEYVCQLCNKESRNKFQLKIHIAQHLGVSSTDISDEFLAGQGVEYFQNKELLISLKRSRNKNTLAVLNALVKSKTIEQDPVFEVGGSSSGLVGADILDAPGGRRTLDPLPDPLAGTSTEEIPFVSVVKEEEPIDTCAPDVQNFEDNPCGESVIHDYVGSMSHIQENVTRERILNEENLQQEEFQFSSTCPECKESFPNVMELETHRKQAHKKPEEILNRVRKDKKKCKTGNPSSSMKRDSKAPGPFKNPRPQQEHTPIKPTSSMGDIARLQEAFKNPTRGQNAQIERELLDPLEDPLAVTAVYDLSSQSTHCAMDTFVGSSMTEKTQIMSSLASPYVHDVFAGDSDVDDNFRMGKVRMARERKPKIAMYCDECPEVFFSQSALHRHQERHRREDLRKCFTCPACDMTFLTAVKLVRHFKVAHKEKFRCRYKCALLFESKEEVLKHYQEFHKVETAFACPYCGLEYQFHGYLLNHLERCTKCPPEERPSHVCGNCEAVLKSRRDYNLHKCSSLKDSENNSGDKKRGQPLTTRDLIPRHPYSCKFCNQKFEEMEAATEHCFSFHLVSLKEMTGEHHTCRVCKKNMLSELELCRHLMSHYLGSGRWDDLLPRNLMETEYAIYAKNYCWICQASIQEDVSQHLFQRNKNVSLSLAHYKETTVSVPFECTPCLKTFQTRTEYWDHVEAHLDELSFESDGSDLGGSCYKECSICLLMCAGTEEYHRHLATHAVVVCDGEKVGGDVVDSD